MKTKLKKKNKKKIISQISKVNVSARPNFKIQFNIFRTCILFTIAKCFLLL